MNPILLASIVAASAQSGFTIVQLADLQSRSAEYTALLTEGLVELGPQNQTDGSYPIRPTDAGKKLDAENGTAEHTATRTSAGLPNHAAVVSTIEIESDVPLPEKKAFGRAPEGTTQVDLYPFAKIEVGQSFFVPQDAGVGADKPKHRTFSSVVSNANKKLAPKMFTIREDVKNGTPGARIWRDDDVAVEDRPKRTRKANVSAGTTAPAAAPGSAWPTPPAVAGAPAQPAAFPGGFPAPGNPAFGAAPQPGGFPPPPAAAGGGFPHVEGFPAPNSGAPSSDAGWGAAPAAANLPGWSS